MKYLRKFSVFSNFCTKNGVLKRTGTPIIGSYYLTASTLNPFFLNKGINPCFPPR